MKQKSDSRRPWRVVFDEDTYFEVWTKEDKTPGSLNNYAIATDIQDKDEAQLIAAAPDLLEACKALVEAFECAGKVYGKNVPATGAMVDAGIKAKAALTKATKGTL